MSSDVGDVDLTHSCPDWSPDRPSNSCYLAIFHLRSQVLPLIVLSKGWYKVRSRSVGEQR